MILVTPVKNLSYFWRPIPNQAECVINATIPPGPPNQISLNTISVKSNETSSFNASWSPPSPPFGAITTYEIVVGRNPIEENGINTSNFYTVLVSVGDMTINVRVCMNDNVYLSAYAGELYRRNSILE